MSVQNSKFKIQNYGSSPFQSNCKFIIRAKSRITIFLTFCFVLLTIIASPIYAQTASPSASPSESSFLQKLNELREEVTSKAAQIKLEINKKLQNKAFAGTIKEISEKEFLIAKKESEAKILINEFTDLEDLEAEDFVAALGDVDDKGNLVAKKIVKLEKPQPNKKKFYFGVTQQVVSNTITISTKTNETLSIVVSNNTQYGIENDEANFSDIASNRKIVVVGVPNKDSVIQAEFIYLVGK